MKTRLHLKPGQRGTRRLVAEYGDRLVCVRYRYDAKTKKRFKTVELIIEEVDWNPKTEAIQAHEVVGIRIDLNERELQQKVRAAGGIWNRERKCWDLRYDLVSTLGLQDRLIGTQSS